MSRFPLTARTYRLFALGLITETITISAPSREFFDWATSQIGAQAFGNEKLAWLDISGSFDYQKGCNESPTLLWDGALSVM
ncbi:hypothetical protein J6590_078576 [Homalodisca vitripennis]|nr:hypothetical protein J6590_078576 [Homalodisca vitripennis]